MRNTIQYHFQAVCQAQWLAGHNLVIQAPTGAGKTRAAVEPGLIGFQRDRRARSHDHPCRLFYLQPMRTLASAGLVTLRRAYTAQAWEREWEPRIQSGDQPHDRLFEGKVIVGTVDQMLASALTMPYSLPRRLDNINAGALIGAYLIFDEFHLYPRHQMMLTVLALLHLLQDVSRFTLMSATFSSVFLKAIASEIGAHYIGDDPASGETLFADVTNVQTQQRIWRAMQGRLDADAVLRLRGRRTLCICNTVERARALYSRVREQLPNVEIVLLHSQFFTADRKRIQARLLAAFEGDSHAPARDIIVIATQVVEVGLDISADVLMTECAPAASLIQRAGRCARREGQAGTVYVFQPFDEDGTVSYAPYDDSKEGDRLLSVCQRTWDALTDSAFDGQVIRFAQEQALIDRAHGEYDAAFVRNLHDPLLTRRGEILRCWKERPDGLLKELIRRIDTVPLFIHPNPSGNTTASTADKQPDPGLTEKPFAYESLSLSRGTIYHLIKPSEEADDSATVTLYGCDGQGTPDDTGADDAMTRRVYRWLKLKEAKEVYSGAYAWFAVQPDAVSYDEQAGFSATPSARPADSSPKAEGQDAARSAFRADTYVEHITGLYRAYIQPVRMSAANQLPLRDEFLFPLTRLCEQMQLDPITGERMMRLALALHDVGKLNRPWQAWTQAWQRAYADQIAPPTHPADGTPLAHTDFDPRDAAQKALMKNLRHPPRGTHAVESAEACFAIIAAACDNHPLWMAVTLTAIMHHHTPTADSCEKFEAVPVAADAVRETLGACGFDDVEANDWVGGLVTRFGESSLKLKKALNVVYPTDKKWGAMLLYLLFVRILRLADQRSSMANHPMNEL